MTFLTKDQLLAPRTLPRREVSVPELATPENKAPKVLLQGLSSAEGDAFLASLQRQNGKKVEHDTSYYSAKLLQLCLVNERGERLFGEGDVLSLAKLPNGVAMRLAGIAQELSGLAAGSVEDAAKN
jgi:hypothetical protein